MPPPISNQIPVCAPILCAGPGAVQSSHRYRTRMHPGATAPYLATTPVRQYAFVTSMASCASVQSYRLHTNGARGARSAVQRRQWRRRARGISFGAGSLGDHGRTRAGRPEGKYKVSAFFREANPMRPAPRRRQSTGTRPPAPSLHRPDQRQRAARWRAAARRRKTHPTRVCRRA